MLNRRGPSKDRCGTPFDGLFALSTATVYFASLLSFSEVTVNKFQTVHAETIAKPQI